MNKDEVKDYINLISEKGIKNILALRGDPPEGEKVFAPPENGFAYANELVDFIKSSGDFTIGVAGYPEGHIEALDYDTDIDNLMRKIDAGADFIITQLFYNNNDFYKFKDILAKKNITIPLVPGIMPVTGQTMIKAITDICGATIPDELRQTLGKCKSDEDVCRAGIDYSIKQCAELKSWDIPGFHFFSMNKSGPVQMIINNI